MFNQGVYFLTLDLTKTKVLLNLGLESFVMRTIFLNENLVLVGFLKKILLALEINHLTDLKHNTSIKV